MNPPQDLVLFVGGAIFHAVTHLLTHETYHGIRKQISDRRILQNHDVIVAVRRSAIAAIELLKQERFDGAPRDHKRALSDFGRRVAAVFDDTTRDIDLHPEDFLVPEGAAARLEDALGPLLPVVPEVREAVLTRFPGLFSYAFREIGLKANARVRAVVIESMLRSLMIQAAATRDGVRDVAAVQGVLYTAVESIGSRVDGLAAQHRTSVADLESALRSLLRRVRALDVIVGDSSTDEGPVRGLVVVSDTRGRQLKSYQIRQPHVTIGRSTSNTIALLDGWISAKHAVMNVGDELTLQDMGSRNGTYLGGVKLSERVTLSFNQDFRIGPYILNVVPPDSTEVPGTPLTAGDVRLFEPALHEEDAPNQRDDSKGQ